MARFPHSDHAPDWWFSLAHSVGRGVELELLALQHALGLLPRIPPLTRISVNTGPETALDPRFPALFEGVDTHRITIELTELTLVEDYPRLLAVIKGLRNKGIALSVDDAGSGYSGLSHIRQLGVGFGQGYRLGRPAPVDFWYPPAV